MNLKEALERGTSKLAELDLLGVNDSELESTSVFTFDSNQQDEPIFCIICHQEIKDGEEFIYPQEGGIVPRIILSTQGITVCGGPAQGVPSSKWVNPSPLSVAGSQVPSSGAMIFQSGTAHARSLFGQIYTEGVHLDCFLAKICSRILNVKENGSAK